MKVLILTEAAEFLRMKPCTLRELVSKREVPGAKVGGEWRFTDESLQAYMRKLVAGESQVIEPPVIPNQKPPARRKPRQPPRLMSSNAGSNGPSGVAAKVRVD